MSEKENDTAKIKKYTSLALTVLTVITAISLIIQTLRIYLTGISSANQPSKGVYIEPIFSTSIIATRFSEISFIVCLWFISLFVCIVIRCIYGFEKEKPVMEGLNEWREKEIARAKASKPNSDKNRKISKGISIVGLIIAIIFVVFGVVNGGMSDVLKKAVMICTECIGIG